MSPLEKHFNAIQNVLTKAAGVLWVVRGAHVSSSSPDLSMVIGLARSIRSESTLKFVTLDLDHRPVFNVHADSAAIMDVIRAIWMAKPPAKDMEYTEREGRLLVPRIVNDVEMNNCVHRETQDATAYLQPFSQSGRPLKLKVGIPGALDTLHFVDDLGHQQPLEPGEVSS